jgi:hypothetical protein
VTVNEVALVAVPAEVTTWISPLVAPVGTVVVIWVPVEFTVNGVALTPLNLTRVAPVRFEPLITTDVPTGPVVGENDVMDGPVTVKVSRLVAVPPVAVAVISPVVAPLGTVARTLVAEMKDEAVACTPLNLTVGGLVKLRPKMSTTVPAVPVTGENELITGAAELTVKLLTLVPTPPGVVTFTTPVEVPTPTVARISLAETTLTLVAGVFPAPTVTEDAHVKFEPVILRTAPTGPVEGTKAGADGAGAVTTKVAGPAIGPPPGVVTATATLPMPTVQGTVAVTDVSLDAGLKMAGTPPNATAVTAEVAPPLKKPVPVITMPA